MNILQRNAKIVVILACIAASTASIFVRQAEGMSSLAIGFYRLGFAMPLLATPVLLRFRDDLRKLTRKQIAGSIVAGMFLFFHFLTWFIAIVKTSIASAVILGSLHPIFILILSAVFFREATNFKIIIGVVLALVGAAIVSSGDYSFSSEAIFGDSMALLAALFMGLYLIVGRNLRPGIHVAVYIFLVFGICWLFFSLGMVVSGTPFTGYSAKSLLVVFAMTLVCQIGAHAVFNWCLGYVSPLYIATSETGEVIFASILAFLLFAEIPVLWQYIGGGVTICGILIYNYFEWEAVKTVNKLRT